MKGMEKGQFYPFTLLMGVCLSDQSDVGNGNLRVFPGSHFILQKPYKDCVSLGLPLNQNLIDVGNVVGFFFPCFLFFIFPTAFCFFFFFPPFPLVPFVLFILFNIWLKEHVLLRPGDVVVVHPLVAHGVGKVTTPSIFYFFFFLPLLPLYFILLSPFPFHLFLTFYLG